MAQGSTPNPEFFHPPGPWNAGQKPPTPGAAVQPILEMPFISSATQVYDLSIATINVPFIGSATQVFRPALDGLGAVLTFDASDTWVCPDGYYTIRVEAWGAGGGGDNAPGNGGKGGGGGGAYAIRFGMAVTPGNTYTLTVGTSAVGTDGGNTSMAGDSESVIAEGGDHSNGSSGGTNFGGAGGLAANSTGDTKHSGGSGGNTDFIQSGGGGGGEAGGLTADGHNGSNGVGGGGPGGAGGTGGSSDGGDGGRGGDAAGGAGVAAGSAPGGGGGGGGGNGSGAAGASGRIKITLTAFSNVPFIPTNTTLYGPTLQSHPLLPFISSVTQVFAPTLDQNTVDVPFISSVTTVYAPTVEGDVEVPFISSVTVVYAPVVQPDYIDIPFIPSHTVVYAITSVWRDSTGPGNGGELFNLQLSPLGSPQTVQLAAAITGSSVYLTFDAPFTGQVADTAFVVTIDDEVILVRSLSVDGLNGYGLSRGMSNTNPASHSMGSDVTWGDTYDMAIESTNALPSYIDAGGTAYGWLVSLDCTQGYLGGSRYATHVDTLLGVFAPGDTVNKLDQEQPNSISAIDGLTNRVPVALSVPARIQTAIDEGDIGLVRYVNPEAGDVLVLGPRSVLLQSWYGFVRVDDTNSNVTVTDPDGHITDGTTSDTFANSASLIFATLDGDDRYFTNPDNGFSDDAILMSGLAIRQGHKRIPLWTSPNWHNFDYVYCGFDDDANFVQIIAKRRDLIGIIPGTGDVSGPNATWDDPGYLTSTAWHVVLTSFDEIIIGPSLNGTPIVTNPVDYPDDVIGVPPGTGNGGGGTPGEVGGEEGGSGGNIDPPQTEPVIGVFAEAVLEFGANTILVEQI